MNKITSIIKKLFAINKGKKIDNLVKNYNSKKDGFIYK
jgi:hypothetical protein